MCVRMCMHVYVFVCKVELHGPGYCHWTQGCAAVFKVMHEGSMFVPLGPICVAGLRVVLWIQFA